MAKKNKKILIFTLFTALFSCLVGGVSTFAWFQLDQRPIQSQMVTGTPNLTVGDNIYGYKINQTLGNNGYISSSNDIVKFGKDNSVTGTNHNQDSSDTNFNVPYGGIGYYLVKKNPGGTFKYRYTTDGTHYTSYSWKFEKYASPSDFLRTSTTINLYAGDSVRLMHYHFTNNKTYNQQIIPSSVAGNAVTGNPETDINSATNDIKIARDGTYKVWFDSNSTKVYFESPTEINNLHLNSEVSLPSTSNNTNTRNRSQVNTKSNVIQSGFSSYTIKTTFTWNDTCRYWVYSDGNGSVSGNYEIWNGSAPFENTSVDSGCFNASTLYIKKQWHYDNGAQDPNNYERQWVIKKTYWGDNLEAGETNYIEITNNANDNSDTYKAQTKSNLNIYYVVNGVCDANPRDTIICWNHDSIATSNRWNGSPTLSGYHFAGWYTTSACTTSAITNGYISNDANIYAKFQPNATVTLEARLFIRNTPGDTPSPTNMSVTLSTDSTTYYKGQSYTLPTTGYNSVSFSDDDNGIYYHANREEGAYWYSQNTCTNNVKLDSSVTISSTSVTYYAKFIVTLSEYKTFYIDLTGSTYNGSNAWTGVHAVQTVNSSKFVSCKPIFNEKLFRLTIRSDYNFRLCCGYDNSYTNENYYYTHKICGSDTPSANQKALSEATNFTSILYIYNTDTNANHTMAWLNQTATVSYGTATIQKYNGSAWVDFKDNENKSITMDTGDGMSNFFIYEHGLQIPVNTKIRIKITDTTENSITSNFTSESTYYVSDYGDVDNPNAAYLKNDSGSLSTTRYTGTARFNFYVITSGKIAVTMVPDYGNGFFIMKYDTSIDSSFRTNHYINSIKMTSNSETMASYEYYYAQAGEEIFIRSYLNAQDNLIKSQGTLASGIYLGTTNGSTATADGVLHFTNKGYYNIAVENGEISVTALDELSSAFKLNQLDTDNVDSAYKIWKQKTSLVLEVPFTCVNDYKSSISLNVSNNLSDFVGVSLCVVEGFSSSKSYTTSDYVVYNGSLYKFTSAHSAGAWNSSHVTEESPYTFMRGSSYLTRSSFYNSLSNGSTITDQRNTQIKSTNSTDYSYAYILVDYLPTRTNNAGYAYGSTSLAGNSAYSGSICTSNIYSSSTFLTTNKAYTISYVLVATQV